MARNDAWMSFYVGDYLRDTGHLTTLEHGAYFLLLIQAWSRDGLLPLDEERLRVLCKLTAKDWNRSREALLAFFYRTENGYRQKRMDAELLKVQTRLSQKIDAGKKSAEKRKSEQKQGKVSTDAALPLDKPLQRNGQRKAVQLQPHKKESKQAAPLPPKPTQQPEPERDASTRIVRPPNPAANAPREAWKHLAEELETSPGSNFGRPIVGSGYLDEVVQMICEAARYPPDYKSSWDWPIAWLKDGIKPHEIEKAVKAVASRPRYSPPTSFRYFDDAVRRGP